MPVTLRGRRAAPSVSKDDRPESSFSCIIARLQRIWFDVLTLTREELNEILRRQQEREAQRREGLRIAVKTSSIPLPPELAKTLINLNDQHFRTILRDHPGFILAVRRDSYRTSLAIAEQSLEDFLVAICRFEAAALRDGSNLLDSRGERELQAVERRVQKELFACTSAAASLVDHARRLNKMVELPEYEARKLACFGTDGLHDFVVGLRVLLHHLHVLEAAWSVTHDFSEGGATATFVMKKATVQRIISTFPERFGESHPILGYVSAAGDDIDLRATFLEYRARMARFHGWMTNQLASASLVALRDYDTLVQRKINSDQLAFWKAMMANWLRSETPPDPHKHLPRFLTTHQLESVYELPLNSKKQVDLVISFLDRNNAIDEELRKQAYELFDRSSHAKLPWLSVFCSLKILGIIKKSVRLRRLRRKF